MNRSIFQVWQQSIIKLFNVFFSLNNIIISITILLFIYINEKNCLCLTQPQKILKKVSINNNFIWISELTNIQDISGIINRSKFLCNNNIENIKLCIFLDSKDPNLRTSFYNHPCSYIFDQQTNSYLFQQYTSKNYQERNFDFLYNYDYFDHKNNNIFKKEQYVSTEFSITHQLEVINKSITYNNTNINLLNNSYQYQYLKTINKFN